MSSGARQSPQDHDPKAGLSPWVIGGALSAAAAVWMIVELIERVL
jgi:hypothetical protein